MMDIPDRDLERSVSHLLKSAERNAGHLAVHAGAAAKSVKDGELLEHHVRHARGHGTETASHLRRLRDAVARRLPAVARELDDLDRAIPGARSAEYPVPEAALAMSIAHDLENAGGAVVQVIRHLAEAQRAQAAGNQESVIFNLAHCSSHVSELLDELSELDADLIRRLPGVRIEQDKLLAAAAADPARSMEDQRRLTDDEKADEWARSMRAGWR